MSITGPVSLSHLAYCPDPAPKSATTESKENIRSMPWSKPLSSWYSCSIQNQEGCGWMAGDMICDRNAGALVLFLFLLWFWKRCKDEDWQTPPRKKRSSPKFTTMFHQNESTFVGHLWLRFSLKQVKSTAAKSNSSTVQLLTSSKVSRLKASIVLYPWEVRFQIKAGEFPLQRIIYNTTFFIFIHIIYHCLSSFIHHPLGWFGLI